MSRPHEDREIHTLVDHRPGGPPVVYNVGAWCAIGIAHVSAERARAEMSAYETLIEKARTTNTHARSAAVLSSVNHRRVIALVGLDGHDAFRHLAAAWDDHHLQAEHRANDESVSLSLYRVTACAGDASIDAASHDAYAFEHVSSNSGHARVELPTIRTAPGFRGAVVFEADEPVAAVTVYRFTHAAEIDGVAGLTAYAVHPAKTFAV